ncbi:DNA (cytosine-5-)-methyltransferase [Pontibacillus yanchengensis]|uniref:DNA (Cytosine-5-)-methyltransferase n=1 Tax=Pontibacillus yanchengensis TaxID=462910 RepID=A0ACC7VHD9_9BACI|nr:DNA (cytosine-5-)-methyltransferase [Pontibacillus yanchengensis]MYL54197.1 DNA (cytosine-5-)-methyltransferase [Pontibacillus yanchengensis]
MTIDNDYKYTVSSLFAGVGGIDKGFEQAGANVIWANEMDKNASITYRKNFNHVLIEADIRDVHEFEMPDDTDIITAGWPCVAFSIAGERHGMKYKCHECEHIHMVSYNEYVNGAVCPECGGKTEAIDPRGTLFYDVVRFIRSKKPKAFFLENVKNLHGHDGGRTFQVIEQMLRDSGYHFESRIYNTMDYGNIPQNRERVFIVGFRNKKALQKFEWPNKVPLTLTIDDVLDRQDKQNDKYYYDESSQYYPMLSESMNRKDTVYQLRRVYVRENQSNVCPTLTANMGAGGHNVPLIIDDWGIRKLTPKETFRFQGFPVDNDYKLPEDMANSHLYMQAGNAVSVPVIRRVAERQLEALNSVYKKNRSSKVKEDKEAVTTA